MVTLSVFQETNARAQIKTLVVFPFSVHSILFLKTLENVFLKGKRSYYQKHWHNIKYN